MSELSLEECVEKYPDFPRLIILKIDFQRRGITYTDKALEIAQNPKYMPSDFYMNEFNPYYKK